MRIVVIHQTYPEAERDIRRAACIASAPPGVAVEFAEIQAGRMVTGDSMSIELFSTLAAPQVVKITQEAEADGADAVVPIGILDLGVDAAPYHASIPVVGAGRTGLHVAAAVRPRIGVIVYDRAAVPLTWRVARECGVDHLVTSVRPVDIPTREMAARKDEMRESIVRLAREQMESEGAEVILPHGISMVPVHLSASELAAEIKRPVIDGLAASMRVAELLASTGYRDRNGRTD